MEAIKLLDCGHEPSPHSECTTGYGQDKNGKTFCYACCAENDRKAMIETGKAVLYLSKTRDAKDFGDGIDRSEWSITNWPGSLFFPVCEPRKSRHNIARWRYDAWFKGPDGFVWHGVQYGDNTQLCHCKRTKETSL